MVWYILTSSYDLLDIGKNKGNQVVDVLFCLVAIKRKKEKKHEFK